jgi:hypothetical protein
MLSIWRAAEGVYALGLVLSAVALGLTVLFAIGCMIGWALRRMDMQASRLTYEPSTGEYLRVLRYDGSDTTEHPTHEAAIATVDMIYRVCKSHDRARR